MTKNGNFFILKELLMKIDAVITETIIAIYREPMLSKQLFLKGGSAMRIFDNLTSRLSIDADFSIKNTIDEEQNFFKAIELTVNKHFQKFNYDTIDFKWERKPKTKNVNKPDWWGGWSCEFKLLLYTHREKSLTEKRRNALIPEGANSSKIIVEISEHEYCGKKRTKSINGVKINGYSRELLVLEKIRAICQQHPDYQYRLSKNRARDFYDIYELVTDADDEFAHRCSVHIKKVFKAKDVPLELLNVLWNKDFIDGQRRGFIEVKDTVIGKVYDFDIYVENLRFLVKDIYPDTGGHEF